MARRRAQARSARRYTLQELADAAGMTIRNIRSYQTRGLIPPPQRQGRHSVYTEHHLRRLRRIRAARARGASLALIASHLASGGSLDVDGLDLPWLPTSRNGSASARQHDTDVPIEGVLTDSAMPRAWLERTIDDLVSSGLLRREGEQVLAHRSLAAGLTDTITQGLPVDRVLEVLATTATAGRSIRSAVEAAMESAAPQGKNGVLPRRELLGLVNRALTTVVDS